MIFDTRRNIRMEGLLDEAVTELSRADKVMAGLIARIGPCQLGLTQSGKPGRSHYFRALVEAIIYQQLSGKAAGTILRRFRELFPSHRFPTTQQILAMPLERMRAVGLSRQKISYIRDLAERVEDGSFPLRRVSRMADAEVITHLTQVKGIGRWTSEMFLIFTLGRPDVLSTGDLAIRKAVQRAYGYKSLPAFSTVARHGLRWQPYRSIASWYLWASVDNGAS
ncbi:MAG: DNA-3-methyladenine glycosylase 2 family protein [Acidobacteria bacterium]|nr:DNA-3-methyladenine glycosylase 2 family protein [Acidobacteriota bacterium]